jgi:hypothetical protein
VTHPSVLLEATPASPTFCGREQFKLSSWIVEVTVLTILFWFCSGSLAARDLTNLVPAEDVKETEYLSTLLVVVSKNDYKDFLAKYENLASFVVPRSAKYVLR